MTVHLQISKQINNHIHAQQMYKELDQKRENAIEEMIEKARKNEEFSTNEVNAYTEQINEVAKKIAFPLRKTVTPTMVLEYIAKK